MSFEMLVALDVANDEIYAQYRREMTPILSRYNGSFGYDFKVSEVLISQVSAPINRVFSIRFPSEDMKNQFFNDKEYMAVKQHYFTPSVRATTLIASYEKPDS
ncbi:DUF1330 domain-containing protein [Photobacterium sp. Hal280]|uniref:DUF1330 domain-containing protein n=1 Tax=Photobacterium sp. Hal280 TaxID=3035163 RepID=UPI00301BB6FA